MVNTRIHVHNSNDVALISNQYPFCRLMYILLVHLTGCVYCSISHGCSVRNWLSTYTHVQGWQEVIMYGSQYTSKFIVSFHAWIQYAGIGIGGGGVLVPSRWSGRADWWSIAYTTWNSSSKAETQCRMDSSSSLRGQNWAQQPTIPCPGVQMYQSEDCVLQEIISQAKIGSERQL